MSNYVNLNIKIQLDGDNKDIIPIYNYSTHSNPSSNYNNIYIPLKTLIGNNDAFKNNIHSKNPKQIFLTTTGLIDFLTNRPKIFHKMSENIHNILLTIKNKIKTIPKNDTVTRAKLIKDIADIGDYINKSNIDLITLLFFKKKTYFFYKNEKYIINNYKITDYGLNKTDIILPSYNDLVNDLIQ